MQISKSGKVLVTGATGRLGSRFVPRLLRHGYKVRILVRPDASRAKRLSDLGAEVVVGDLGDAEVVGKALDGTTSVIHLAAQLRRVTPEQSRAINQNAAVSLAELALDRGIRRFVFGSTILIYGPGYERPAREFEPAKGTTAYPAAKAAAEIALGELHRNKELGLRILRFAFVYGEGDPHLEESLPKLKYWSASKRFQMVHHADVGQALFLALQTEGIDGETFNVADDAPLTLAELRALNGLNETSEPTGVVDATSAWDVITDTQKIRSMLGYRPYYPSFLSAWEAGAL